MKRGNSVAERESASHQVRPGKKQDIDWSLPSYLDCGGNSIFDNQQQLIVVEEGLEKV